MYKFIPKNISIVLISSVIICSGCEKYNQESEENSIRIKKIADNKEMADPIWAFEYDSEGFLKKITGTSLENTDFVVISYNAENIPVAIYENIIVQGSLQTEYHIMWGENTFTVIKQKGDMPHKEEEYYTDTVGRIIGITSLEYFACGPPHLKRYVVQWDENRMDLYSQKEDIDNEWLHTQVVDEYKNPLTAINIAILNVCGISSVFSNSDYTFQNISGLSMSNSKDEGITDYEYIFNEEDYPTQVLINNNGSLQKHLYFEYETD